MKKFPFSKQLDSMDCGPTCLRMVSEFYGKKYPLLFLRERCYIDRAGVSIKGISEAAEAIGLRTLAARIPLTSQNDTPSLTKASLPVIVHWNYNHFIVVYKISAKEIWVADPEKGRLCLSYNEFKQAFQTNGQNGVALLLETTPKFYESHAEKESKKGINFLLQYLKPPVA